MTLVPSAESGNTTVKTLDDRRIFEIVTASAAASTSFTDFEGRLIKREGSTLTIGPAASPAKAAQVTVRWRFGKPAAATVDGQAARLETTNGETQLTLGSPAAGHPTVVAWH